MKLSNLVKICAVGLLVTTTSRVDGSCTSSNNACQVGSGDCTAAVRLALGGDLVAAGDAAFYGKYCGARNKCQVVKGSSSSSDGSFLENANTCEMKDDNYRRRLGKKTKGKRGDQKMHKKTTKKSKKKTSSSKSSGSKHHYESDDGSDDEPPCPAVPCDAIDLSCSFHDTCLDQQLLLTPPIMDGERLSIPERCACDVDLVYDMAMQVSAASTTSTGTGPTGLCDDAFYQEPLFPKGPTSLQLLGHEGVFVAAPFCCGILTETTDTDTGVLLECEMDASTDQDKFAVAREFCQTLEDRGLPICGLPEAP